MERNGRPLPVGSGIVAPARARLLVVLLIIGLTTITAYAGCHQLRSIQSGHQAPDQVEAVRAIHNYIARVERALRSIDDSLGPNETSGVNEP